MAQSNLINFITPNSVYLKAVSFKILINLFPIPIFISLKYVIPFVRIKFKIVLQTLQVVIYRKLLTKSFHLFAIKETLFLCFYALILLSGSESFKLTTCCHFQTICFTKVLKASQQLDHRFLLTVLVI